MTNEEAIKKVDDVLSSDYHYDETLGYQLTSDDFEWLEEAKKALEKQIPKKCEMNEGRTEYRCPLCGKCVGSIDDMIYCEVEPKFCFICGQALEW